MSTWRNQRKAERRAEWLAEAEQLEREEQEWKSQSLFMKIEGITDIPDVRRVLHEIADRIEGVDA